MILLLAENKLMHSLSVVSMEKPPAALLVVSPNHGKAKYLWEYKYSYQDKWNIIKVPSYTCLLYVDTARKYRCTVDGKTILFDVKGLWPAQSSLMHILTEHPIQLKRFPRMCSSNVVPVNPVANC